MFFNRLKTIGDSLSYFYRTSMTTNISLMLIFPCITATENTSIAQPSVISGTISSKVVTFVKKVFARNSLIVSQSKFGAIFIKSFLDASIRMSLNI